MHALRPQFVIALARIGSSQYDLKMAHDRFVTTTSAGIERVKVTHQQGTAPRLQKVFSFENLEDSTGIAATNAQHDGQFFMCHRHAVISGSIHRGKDPFCRALLDGMDGVAGRGLKNLCEQTIGISRK